jgi:carbonic anhydrase
MKMNSIASWSILAALFLCTAAAIASGGAPGMKPEEALQKLMDGNKRYVENSMGACGQTNTALREGLAKGQKPYAIILSCSDSRVSPEIIFDKTLGEIFVVRVAGNIPDPIVLGSIEYAAEHLGSPLILVLGHERCGAVTAAVDAKGKPEGNIGAIVKRILPAVKEARKMCKDADKQKLVECAIDSNVALVAKSLTSESKVLAHMVKEGKLQIVTAKYDLDDGKVTLFDKK